MKHCSRAFWPVLGLVLLGLAHQSPARADRSCDNWVARLVSAQGRVEQRRAGKASWSASMRDTTFCPGDALRTGADSRAALLLPNETLVRLDQLTTLILPEAKAQETGLLVELLRGIGYFFSRTPKKLEIKAPFVNAAIEGTEFLVSADRGESSVLVLEGIVRASNAKGSLRLTNGEGAIAGPGEAPRRILVANPRDAVQWALYYPPVIGFRTGDPDIPVGAVRAIAAFEQGDIAGALSALDLVPERERSPGFYGLRASILLYVGRVEKSRADIARALNLDPAYGGALALQSIIALVRNDSEAAMRFAEKGTEARGAEGAASQVALSYVYQSRFDLDGALEHARTATELAPDNPLAWARVAQISLALRDLDAALRAAEKAKSLNPRISRIQTTLGFAQLLSFDASKAAASFRRAIALDQGDPLPRLGLGLAKIHLGQIRYGREDLAIAVSIDPTTSIFRSYLGKAYYDEKRDKRAATEYRIAEGLDSRDPTPWFYDAIREQTSNRLVDALDDIRRSIMLNDNRAVYRSSLLLDSDLAARSTSQARIYTDLGFNDLALIEGWRSVNEDPENFSAHRFLADAYLGSPGYEVARASELLQSQLWQPLNLNPIQPQLARTNLSIIQSAGPSLAGLDEYNPLFLSDGVQAQANLLAGGDNTIADDLAVSVVEGMFSLAAGQFHFQTDGFRPNADQSQDLYNLFLQISPSPRGSMQVEYRNYETDLGDTILRFDPEDYSPALRLNHTSSTLRMGGRYEFSPKSKMIGSIIGEEWRFTQGDQQEGPPSYTLDTDTKSRSLSAEVQHVYASGRLNLISGIGYMTVQPETTGEITLNLLPPPFPPLVIPLEQDDDFENNKAYLYANYALNDALAIHAGASYNDCTNPYQNRAGLDPKLGLTWQATETTRVRAAAFQTIRCVGSYPGEPALALPQPENLTIEPTQLAGFNQLFDDPPASTSDVFGIAVDQQLTRRIFGGAAVTRRDIEVPISTIGEGSVDENWREDYARAYFDLALDRNWALALAYQYDMQDYTTSSVANGVSKLTTLRVPVSLRFFSESGVSAGITASYIDQEAQLFDTLTGLGEMDREHFWLVDASLVYRLPKRYGFLSLEVRNLLNEDIRFQEPDPNVPTLYPDRLFLAKLSLTFN
jgi:tetratricopeptide (TPR) repeat protein